MTNRQLTNNDKLRWALITISILIIVLLWTITMIEFRYKEVIRQDCIMNGNDFVEMKFEGGSLQFCGHISEIREIINSVKEESKEAGA